MKIINIINTFYKAAERISGGLADKVKVEKYTKDPILNAELEKGIRAEMVHTSERIVATELAMDNLEQDPNYYKKLNSQFLNPRK